MPFNRFLARIGRSIRWRLGLQVAAPELESGNDADIAAFYQNRVTDCAFLLDPAHYEYPRAEWIVRRVTGGRLLEIGCGNGGMTRPLSSRVDHVIAMDISSPSLAAVASLGLANVQTVESLVEKYEPPCRFDWIVMSEVLEHLRRPVEVVRRCCQWLVPKGTLLITTPNGHWESNEHLHVFDLANFAQVVSASDAENLTIGYLRDSEGRRRWLTAEVKAPEIAPTPDNFNDRHAIARRRRQR